MRTIELLSSVLSALENEADFVGRAGENLPNPKPRTVIVVSDIAETGLRTYGGLTQEHLIQVSAYADSYFRVLEITERIKEILAKPEGLNLTFRAGRPSLEQEDGRKGKILEFEY